MATPKILLHVLSSATFAATLLTTTPPCQVTAAWSPYGTGCSGTGTGLGANNVLPANQANQFGGSDNSIPFTWSPVRYQQALLGTDLPAAFTMAGLSLRQDERGPIAHGVTVDLEIQIGLSRRARRRT